MYPALDGYDFRWIAKIGKHPVATGQRATRLIRSLENIIYDMIEKIDVSLY